MFMFFKLKSGMQLRESKVQII